MTSRDVARAQSCAGFVMSPREKKEWERIFEQMASLLARLKRVEEMMLLASEL